MLTLKSPMRRQAIQLLATSLRGRSTLRWPHWAGILAFMGNLRWNSSLHAFERLLLRVPKGSAVGLDVGCGEGETARRLRTSVPSVVGIDPDRASIEAARSFSDDIDYLVTDLNSAELPEASFDVVSAVAVLHHVDHRAALTRLASLVRPGGVLLVVGLARSRSMGDYGRDLVDSIGVRRHTLVNDVWTTPAPKIWPAPLSYAQTRAATFAVLPDASFERLPFFRYGISWQRPGQ